MELIYNKLSFKILLFTFILFSFSILVPGYHPACAQDNVVLSISPDNVAGKPGDNIQVDVNLTQVSSMAGISFCITYDPQIVKPLSDGVKPGTLLSPSMSNPYYQGKKVKVIWASATSKSGSGKVCSITFQLLKAGQSKLELDEVELLNSKVIRIPCTTVNGLITVQGEVAPDNSTGTGGNTQSNLNTNTNSNSNNNTNYGGHTSVNNNSTLNQGTQANISTNNNAPPNSIIQKPLKDVSDHWASNYVKQLVNAGIFTGYPDSTFKPDNTITRAEFAQIISKAIKLPAGDTSTGLKDWNNTASWARSGIAAAVKAGIIKGYEDGSFRPDQPISRSEMAVMIMKAMKKEIKTSGSTTFSDNSQIPSWALPYVEEAVKSGIITGKGTNQFKPADRATRAEAACMLVKLLNKI